MKRVLFLLLFVALILLVPFAIQQLIQYRQLPKSVTIVTGKEGGRYKEIADALGRKIEAEHGSRKEKSVPLIQIDQKERLSGQKKKPDQSQFLHVM